MTNGPSELYALIEACQKCARRLKPSPKRVPKCVQAMLKALAAYEAVSK